MNMYVVVQNLMFLWPNTSLFERPYCLCFFVGPKMNFGSV